jgi:Tol biopolymer transport system component
VTRRRVCWAMAIIGAVIALAACAPRASSTPSPTRSLASATFASFRLPSDSIVFDSDRGGNYEIFSMRSDGSAQRPLTADLKFDSFWGRISPERSRILFHRTPRGTHDRDYTKASLWVMNGDGTDLRELRPAGTDGWDLQGHAEWSPDGRQIAIAGGRKSNTQIFILDHEGKTIRQLTDRGGTNIDPSWSPDARTILFIGCPSAICFENDYEVHAIPATGGAVRRLTHNSYPDFDPYFSPDGGRIAWLAKNDSRGALGAWNVFAMNADGTDQRNLTNDGNVNSKPQWSGDGRVLYFHRLEPGRTNRWSIFSIRADGTELTEITKGAPGNNEYPAN